VARLLEGYWEIRDFLDAGGDVLFLIMGVTLVMWTLIAERFWYYRFDYRNDARGAVDAWNSRVDRVSWHAQQVRRWLISGVALKLRRSTQMIKTMVALCPLLGLLGTVMGMIEVFEVMAIAGSGTPRAMAAGVSKATIPTMAGMVAALSGLYFSVRLEAFAAQETERMEDLLTRSET
jgi:biopolymer transport protein ExbB